MSRLPHPAFAALLSALILTACGTDGQTTIETTYPVLPDTHCAREPAPPPVAADDKLLALWLDSLQKAGADCRDKLDAIDSVVAKWPKHGSATN